MSHYIPKIPPEIIVPVLLFCAPLLHGNTISLSAFSSFPLDDFPQTPSCAISGPGAIACDIHPTFSDVYLRHQSHADVSGRADFGAISGGALAFSDDADVTAAYMVSFSDFVTVLGGTGTGTLVAHYRLTSSSSQFRSPGQARSPSYFLTLGNSGLSFTANLPTAPPDPNNGGRKTDDLDVSSTFLFGTPLGISAQTQARVAPMPARGSYVGVGSAVVITGYTVLDSSGAVVTDAVVVPGSVPEPAPWVSILGGVTALVWMSIRKKSIAPAYPARISAPWPK